MRNGLGARANDQYDVQEPSNSRTELIVHRDAVVAVLPYLKLSTFLSDRADWKARDAP